MYAKYPGTCPQLIANATYRTEAQAAADDYRERNRDGSSGMSISTTCNADGELEVGYSATGSTNYAFGQLASGEDSKSTSRTASGLVDVASRLSIGLRPMALCSAALPPSGTTSDVVTRIDYPGGGHAPPPQCPVPSTPGNWWTVDCPGERTGSTSTMQQQILNGCPDAVEIVPGTEGETLPRSSPSCSTRPAPRLRPGRNSA